MKFDIISIGDATEDVFLQLSEAKVHCNLGPGPCKLCMDWATKIPIKRVDKLIGGNSSNLALGMAKLGFKPAFYLEVGQDDQGDKIFNAMKDGGVSTKYIIRKKGVMTNYSVVLNLGPERTILIYHVKRKYKLPKFDNAEWAYYSSMGEGFQVIHKDLLAYLKKSKAQLGFNPGTHQMRSGVKVIGEFYKRSKVLLLNKEEVQLVTGKKTNNIRELLKAEKKLGPEIAVLTDGPAGSYVYDGKNFWFQDIFDVPVIERTGCGDAYSTGFMAALMYGLDIEEAMRWGTMSAAYVIQKIGPQQGQTNLATMKRMLKKNPDFHPVPYKG